ncbi:DUF732 domain-containing protein [Rhodococcus sp. NPDC060176]|uniref:DUF732 domain-containing protein n=1 Tax=Rhodococcus sp. NPDC060176 TaxID=3347062 RepID=UPI0036529552
MKRILATGAAIGLALLASACSNDSEPATTKTVTTQATSVIPTTGRLADAAFLDELDSRGMQREDSDTRIQRGVSICSNLKEGDTVQDMVDTMAWKYNAAQARIIISASQNVYCPETK